MNVNIGISLNILLGFTAMSCSDDETDNRVDAGQTLNFDGDIGAETDTGSTLGTDTVEQGTGSGDMDTGVAFDPDTGEETIGACSIGGGEHTGSGRTEEQYMGADVQRDGKYYRMITNGWGQNWRAHDISWLGSTMTVHDYDGSRQSNGAPAGYPSVFCGRYSDTSQDCGLPRPISEVTAINTSAVWNHPAGDGTYNVAYDVWLGDGDAIFMGLRSYFMVWLRDPPGEQPAGSLDSKNVKVAGVPGNWNIISGRVNGLPIVNYVRAEGNDAHAIAFDMMDFLRDARERGFELPGDDLLAVAIGFEIWEGPVTELALEDFCLDIQ